MTGTGYIVQAWNGKRWAKVRGVIGGPWHDFEGHEGIGAKRAARMAAVAERDNGKPHRVVQQ